MRTQHRQDATRAVDHPMWLIVQDRMNQLVAHVELAPFMDLPLVLSVLSEQLQRRGWTIEAAPRLAVVGFFCNREGERWFVHLVHYDPCAAGHHVPRTIQAGTPVLASSSC
jgi:hypothetical protein